MKIIIKSIKEIFLFEKIERKVDNNEDGMRLSLTPIG